MKNQEDIAKQVAEYLLKIEAVKLNATNPFTWASGLRSPIYCDNRITLSYPDIRNFIKDLFVRIIRKEFNEVDAIAGVATGGIAQGALVAQELDVPFVYIRSSQKAHGLENKVEGRLKKDQHVVVVEDLISTGKSSLNAVKAVRDSECTVLGMVAIFTYNLDIAINNFKEAGVPLFTLSNYGTLIDKALEHDYIKSNDLELLVTWRKDPKMWGERFN